MKKKLPILSKPAPASAQTELAVKPVAGGSRPEFPKRNDLYRKAGIISSGAAVLLVGCVASAEAPKKPVAAPQKPADKPAEKPADKVPVADSKPAPPPPPPQEPTKPKIDPNDPALANGSIDGQAIDLKKAPAFKVYREGGGIGPAEDMWEPKEVEAFINWQMAKEGKLAIQTNYKLDFDGESLTLRGYDATKKVGYAYIDKLDSDDAFTKDVQKKLAAWQKAKKVAILFIEVKKVPDQATLKGKVLKFLADVKKNPMTPGDLK